jgi:Na+-transporting methylmalonyl-CoA/oxaloacetate decarboxylase gamma subunit
MTHHARSSGAAPGVNRAPAARALVMSLVLMVNYITPGMSTLARSFAKPDARVDDRVKDVREERKDEEDQDEYENGAQKHREVIVVYRSE